DSPTIDPEVLKRGIPVLGICYGHQLMTHLLGGKVRKGDKGEYGFAQLEVLSESGVLSDLSSFSAVAAGGATKTPHVSAQESTAGSRYQVWMSHRDTVQQV